MRKLSSTSIYLLLFIGIIVLEAYSAFSQSNDDIAGYWKTGSVGSIQYQNRATGSTKPGRSSLFTYKFHEDGSYEFVGYMEVTMYNCTTTMFNQVNGKYSVDGSTLILEPFRDLWKSGNSCAASGNKEQTKTPTRKTLEFTTKDDGYGNRLLCLSDGGSETCYRREKE